MGSEFKPDAALDRAAGLIGIIAQPVKVIPIPHIHQVVHRNTREEIALVAQAPAGIGPEADQEIAVRRCDKLGFGIPKILPAGILAFDLELGSLAPVAIL